MLRSKKIDIVCIGAIVLAMIIACTVMSLTIKFAPETTESSFSNPANNPYISTEYVDHIFDDSFVHEIDIRLPNLNWDYLVNHATEEQYVLCDVVVDGEVFKNVAIRPKGNSSLGAIKSQNSDHFSFKIEFDHYHKNSTYYGLDKLALNNLGQDKSCMKDFLCYHMMNEIGIAAPLSSFVELKLNGQKFGLYLAVEAIEDSFAKRNYGNNFGNIYKPECFEISNVTPKAFMNTEYNLFETDFESLGPGDRADILGTFIRSPFETAFGENMEVAALKYVGNDPARYNVMFDFSVFENTKADKEAFINAVQILNSTEEDVACEALDVESVIKYLIVHNFVNNYDSYSGIFVHNYYIRESGGKLSMIPWDYNLAFGIFTIESFLKSFLGENSPYDVELKIGSAMSDAKGMVNYPIDSPTISVEVEERPLVSAILNSEKYRAVYHEYFKKFLDDFFASGKFEELYKHTWNIIHPYVADGQIFYEYEDACRAVEAVHDYCVLREQSIRGQLEGKIPATMEGQRQNWENLVETEGLDLFTSVSFDSLVFGISSKDVIEILDAIAGDNEHNSAGVTKSIEAVKEDSKEIGRIAGRLFSSSGLIKRSLRGVFAGPLALIISLVALAMGLKIVKKYSRRRPETPVKTGRGDL